MSSLFDLIKFMEWTVVKARLQISEQTQHPQKKEIWWVALGQNIGVEANGKNASFERPALVIREFNADSFLIAPLTSTSNAHKFIIKVGTDSSINIFQLRTVSVKRFLRKHSDLEDAAFNMIIDNIKEHIFIKEKPPQLKVFRAPSQEGE